MNENAHISTDPASLLSAGFVAVRYIGQEELGTFYRRDTRVDTMPYLGRQTDNEYIFGTCVACTEVRPDGKVYIMISETDYAEEAVEASSDEGQGLLRDAAEGTSVDLDDKGRLLLV